MKKNEPYYAERRRMTVLTRLVCGFFVAAGFLAPIMSAIDGSSVIRMLPLSGLWWAMAGGFLALGRSRYGVDHRSLRVDAKGLTVRDRFVPAKRLGRIELISNEQATREANGMFVNGLPIGWTQCTYAPTGQLKPAVLVEDLGGGHRPGWLLASRDPEAFAAALERARDRVRGPNKARR